MVTRFRLFPVGLVLLGKVFFRAGLSYDWPTTSNLKHISRVGVIYSSITPSQNLNLLDSDSDGIPDSWEIAYWLDISSRDGSGDYDLDGLSDLDEFNNQSNPLYGDTDEDGLSDFLEVTVHNTDPAKGDTDGDGFSDFDEVDSSSDPNLSSSYPGSEPPWFIMMYYLCKILVVPGDRHKDWIFFLHWGSPIRWACLVISVI